MFHQPSPSPPRGPGVSPKLVVLAAGLMVGLAVLAFAAGIVWRARVEPGRSSASATETPVPRSSGAAGRAATTIEESLRQVAEVCALDINGLPSRDVLELAQEACGRDEFQRREDAQLKARAGNPPYQPYEPPPRPTPVTDNDDDDDDDATATPSPQRDVPPRPRQPPAAGDPPAKVERGATGCRTCGKQRSECAAGCGPEPLDASRYDGFLACTGRCVAQESRCRQTCR